MRAPGGQAIVALVLSFASLALPTFSSAAPSPLATYDFDAGAGTVLADRSGNNHPGTLVNGPVWTSGKYGGGLAFDGVNDYVTMGDVAQADALTSVTVSTWVKFAVAGGGANEIHFVDKSLCAGYGGGGPWELGVSLTSAHKAEFVIYPHNSVSATYVFSGPSTTSIDDGAWHHVTGRYDGANLSIWVDGNLENSRRLSGVTMLNTTYGVELGGHCNGVNAPYSFKGSLDDVRIYARALTASEILADIATPVGGGTPPAPDTSAPTTPINLNASSVTTSQATLSWQASTDDVGVTGYRLYRNGSLVGTSSTTSHTATGLAANTTYSFTVTAFDSAGNSSAQSAPRQVTTPGVDTSAPSTPTGLAASGVTTSQITITWQASSDNIGVAGYNVYRNGTFAGSVTATSFTATGLAANTSYVFNVTAFDAAQNISPQSAPLQVTTASQPPPPDTAAPSTPTGLAASGVTTSQATLSWQASTDNIGVSGYRVFRNGALVGTTASTTFTTTGLTAGTTYSFTVTAYDAAGNASPQSTPLQVTTASQPPPPDTAAPSTPTGLAASGVTTTQATLSWQASTDNVGVSGYRVYRNGALAGSTASTTFTASGLAASTTYSFTVAAYDAAGNASPQSAPRSVTTAAAAAPPPGAAPLASYDFDAGAGTVLADRSGNNHPGTLVNGPVWTSGKYGGGLAFDGVNDYVTMGDVAQADALTRITVSTWVKFAVAGSGASEIHFVDKSLCAGQTGGGPWELGISLTSARKAEFVIYPQNGQPAAYVFSGPSTTSIDDGAWHHVTGRYDGANLSIWVDGNLENSRPLSGVAMPDTAYGVELGGHCNGVNAPYSFKGSLDDVRIYARALTASEILADIATPVGGGTPPPSDTTAPTTPTGLTASGVTTSQATLSWQASTDNVGVAGYRVYRNGALAGTSSTTSYTATGLAANTTYAFTVVAFDSAGNSSAQSAPLQVTTPTSGPPNASYSTTFGATENPISEGGLWTNGQTTGLDWHNVRTTPGKAFGADFAPGYDDDVAVLNTSFTANQYAQATVYRAAGYSPSANHEVELLLHFRITPHNARGYEVLWAHQGIMAIVRWNGPLGSYTPLLDNVQIGQAVDGDVLRAEIINGVIRVYKNGTLVGTASDNTWTDGQPGIGFWPKPGATPANYGWRGFEAGNR